MRYLMAAVAGLALVAGCSSSERGKAPQGSAATARSAMGAMKDGMMSAEKVMPDGMISAEKARMEQIMSGESASVMPGDAALPTVAHEATIPAVGLNDAALPDMPDLPDMKASAADAYMTDLKAAAALATSATSATSAQPAGMDQVPSGLAAPGAAVTTATSAAPAAGQVKSGLDAELDKAKALLEEEMKKRAEEQAKKALGTNVAVPKVQW